MEFLMPRAPRWNLINVNSRNIRETGVNAVQEVAFVLSLACDYIRGLLDRGVAIDAFAPRMAFFSAVHVDLFEEVAKFRAMRRIWARILKERFGARNPKSMWCRVAVQTSALPLTAQEPMNNIVRSSIQTLAAVLAGTQSIHTTAYDEAYCLPTEEAQKLAIRTQQIIAYETSVMKSVDPLGGSYLVETLTNEIEDQIWELMKVIEAKGGFIQCFKQGWVEEQLNEARYRMADAIEKGEQLIVGVNIFKQEGVDTEIELFEQEPDMQAKRIEYVRQYKKNRNQEPVQKALEALYETVQHRPETNLMDPVMDAVIARATLQEICDAMRRACHFEIPA
jgi:methylmalonyl-CoA mutase N-terminal domain/subunit